MSAPLVRVSRVEFSQSQYTKWGQGQHKLTLSCGHVRWQKSSIKIPRRVRCQECKEVK